MIPLEKVTHSDYGFSFEPHEIHQRLFHFYVYSSLLQSHKAMRCRGEEPLQRWSNHALSPLVRAILTILKSDYFGGIVLEPAIDDEVCLTEVSCFTNSLANSLGTVLAETRNTNGDTMPSQEYVEIHLSTEESYAPELLHFADPTLPWPLHTDRTLHQDPGDFLLIHKATEEQASGGAIRLLHIDDFDALDEFIAHPNAFTPLEWKGDERLARPHAQTTLRQQPGVTAPVFTKNAHGKTNIRFTDSRFRRPQSIEQLRFLSSLDAALREQAETIPSFHLKVGGLYIVNNRIMLHGRSGFKNTTGFKRVLHRYCGSFF